MIGDSTTAKSISSPVGPGTATVTAPPREAAALSSSGAAASWLAIDARLSVYAR